MQKKEFEDFLSRFSVDSNKLADLWYGVAEICLATDYSYIGIIYNSPEDVLEDLKQQIEIVALNEGMESAKLVINSVDIPLCLFPWDIQQATIALKGNYSQEELESFSCEGLFQDLEGFLNSKGIIPPNITIKEKYELYPCLCGSTNIQLFDKKEMNDFFYTIGDYCFSFKCKDCGRGVFYKSPTPESAQEAWNNAMKWEPIFGAYYFEYQKNHPQMILTPEDKQEIIKVRRLLKEESKLVGYHPHKSCEIMGRYQNTEKYQLSAVFEHTGLSEFTLYRNKYAGMIIDGES